MLSEDAGTEWASLVDQAICRDADEMIEAMSVMTPDRMARFTGALLALADRFSQTMPPSAPRRIAPPAPEAGPSGRPTPLAFEAPARVTPVPVPVYIAPAPSAPVVRRRPPPVLCPESR